MGVAALGAALTPHPIIFVDTMVIVYLLENHPVYGDVATTVMSTIEQGVVTGVTSMLTLAELLTGPAQAEFYSPARLPTIPDELSQPDTPFYGCRCCPQGRNGACRHVLRTPDAIQLATAELAGATAIVGNDKGWKGRTGALDLLLLDAFLV